MEQCPFDARTPMRLYLTSFTRNDVLIYQYDIPTPEPNGIHDIQTGSRQTGQATYTLQGVRVSSSSLPSGIYIRGGRKYVVR